MTLWEKFINGLRKTRSGIWNGVKALFKGDIDDEFFDELEEILIRGDVGVATTMSLVEDLRDVVKKEKLTADELLAYFKDMLVEMLPQGQLATAEAGLKTLLFVGVNGSGKTTSLAKVGHRLKEEGKNVVIAAADTYRAAAIDQLQIWGERLAIPVIAQSPGADPAAVVFDAKKAALARDADYLLVDTAGRLHTEKNLMAELGKIKRVLVGEDNLLQIILVIDATNGQNALEQGRAFNGALEVDGVIVTKLDGTAKGGIVFALAKELNLPVFLIGLGESREDLKPFERNLFVESLLS